MNLSFQEYLAIVLFGVTAVSFIIGTVFLLVAFVIALGSV